MEYLSKNFPNFSFPSPPNVKEWEYFGTLIKNVYFCPIEERAEALIKQGH